MKRILWLGDQMDKWIRWILLMGEQVDRRMIGDADGCAGKVARAGSPSSALGGSHSLTRASHASARVFTRLSFFWGLGLLIHACGHSLAHSFIHSSTHSVTHLPAPSLTHPHKHSLTHPSTHSVSQSVTYPPTHSFTHTPVDTLTHSLNSLSSTHVHRKTCLHSGTHIRTDS